MILASCPRDISICMFLKNQIPVRIGTRS
jgi:hypothetical protein